jgi:hypothetical protein
MTDMNRQSEINLQAILLADHIYQDKDTGKYVIAGTFHQLNVPSFPATLGKIVNVFISLTGLTGKAAINLEFVDASSGKQLMHMSSLEISCDSPDVSVDFAVEVPPLPLPNAGRYLFRASADGNLIGEVALYAKCL